MSPLPPLVTANPSLSSRNLAKYAIACARETNITRNIYFASNPLKRFVVRRNLANVIKGVLQVNSRTRVLDFGPGFGVLFPVLSRLFGDVVALDVDGVELSLARQTVSHLGLTNVECIKVNIDNELGAFVEAEFDCIVADNVLEHVEGAAQLLFDFERILKPDGILVVSLPSENAAYRMFESKDSGHVHDTGSAIEELITALRRRFTQEFSLDSWPFFKTRVYRSTRKLSPDFHSGRTLPEILR